jgi:hypothetical protein
MAETYKKVLPGNWVNHINAWPQPTADFVKNKRPSGDPRDRLQQGVLIQPGWLAIHKVGYVHIPKGDPPAAAGGLKGYDIVIPSPDTMAEKPRADVIGMIIPEKAIPYRIGIRIPRVEQQPGFYSGGVKDPLMPPRSGLLGNPGAVIHLDTDAAGGGTAGVSETALATDKLAVGATGDFNPDEYSISIAPAKPVANGSELVVKLWADQGGLGSDLIGGVYVIAEVMYLVEDVVAGPDQVQLPGASLVSGLIG